MSVDTTTLANGLRVMSARMDAVETVSLGCWVNVGARHEAEDVNGVAHMLEHMAFKGTSRRSARAIAEEIESVGGHLDAYTSREFTAYHATVLAGDEELAVDIIADILRRPAFDPAELERERAVILQEIGQVNDTPDDLVFDLFQEAAFPGQPVGRPVLGTPERVAGMPRAALIDYMREHYTAPRMAVAAAGKIDHDRFARRAAAAFDGLAATAGAAPAPARYAGGDARRDRDLEQVHIVLGLEGVAYDDPDYYAMAILSAALGGGMSSRLFQDIREDRGLVYSIHSFGSTYVDSGILGVYAGTGAETAGEVVELICRHVRELADGIAEPELRRARAQFKAGIAMSLESTAARAEQIACQALVHGRPLSIPETIARIDAVDARAIERLARRLRAGPPTLAAIGPVAGIPDYDAVAAALA